MPLDCGFHKLSGRLSSGHDHQVVFGLIISNFSSLGSMISVNLLFILFYCDDVTSILLHFRFTLINSIVAYGKSAVSVIHCESSFSTHGIILRSEIQI